MVGMLPATPMHTEPLSLTLPRATTPHSCRLDFLRYSWSALMVNQFEDGRDMQWTEDGRTVLEYYGMKGLNKWEAMSYLFAFFTFFVLMVSWGLRMG